MNDDVFANPQKMEHLAEQLMVHTRSLSKVLGEIDQETKLLGGSWKDAQFPQFRKTVTEMCSFSQDYSKSMKKWSANLVEKARIYREMIKR